MDHRGGYLFAVVNPFDSSVDVGVLLEPAGSSHTNVSLILSDSKRELSSAAASFLVPQFTHQWTQLAFSVRRGSVSLYFKCQHFGQKAVISNCSTENDSDSSSSRNDNGWRTQAIHRRSWADHWIRIRGGFIGGSFQEAFTVPSFSFSNIVFPSFVLLLWSLALHLNKCVDNDSCINCASITCTRHRLLTIKRNFAAVVFPAASQTCVSFPIWSFFILWSSPELLEFFWEYSWLYSYESPMRNICVACSNNWQWSFTLIFYYLPRISRIIFEQNAQLILNLTYVRCECPNCFINFCCPWSTLPYGGSHSPPPAHDYILHVFPFSPLVLMVSRQCFFSQKCQAELSICFCLQPRRPTAWLTVSPGHPLSVSISVLPTPPPPHIFVTPPVRVIIRQFLSPISNIYRQSIVLLYRFP